MIVNALVDDRFGLHIIIYLAVVASTAQGRNASKVFEPQLFNRPRLSTAICAISMHTFDLALMPRFNRNFCRATALIEILMYTRQRFVGMSADRHT